jgi:hypothetical protein
MSIKHIIATAIIVAGLTSTASAVFYYSEDFNSMGTTGTTPPAGWSMWILDGSSAAAVIPTSAEMAAAVQTPTVPSLDVWNQTTSPNAMWYDLAANMGSTASDANRLLGTSPNNSRGSILDLSLINSSGAALSSITLAYDMKCMAAGTLKSGYPPGTLDELPGYSFYYLDGSDWIHVPDLDLSNDTVNSVGHASATITYSSPVANGGVLEFRWFDDNAAGFAPDTMYAIDNVLIPEPGTLSLLAVGALALVWRRRKA